MRFLRSRRLAPRVARVVALTALCLAAVLSASSAPAPHGSVSRSGEPADDIDATPGQAGGDENSSREQWFYGQRAYPNGATPPAALVQ